MRPSQNMIFPDLGSIHELLQEHAQKAQIFLCEAKRLGYEASLAYEAGNELLMGDTAYYQSYPIPLLRVGEQIEIAFNLSHISIQYAPQTLQSQACLPTLCQRLKKEQLANRGCDLFEYQEGLLDTQEQLCQEPDEKDSSFEHSLRAPYKTGLICHIAYEETLDLLKVVRFLLLYRDRTGSRKPLWDLPGS